MRVLDRLEEVLVGALLLAMVILNFGNVLSRYLLGASWSFTGEILLIAFIWLVFLASAIAYKRNQHLGLPLLAERVPSRWRWSLIVFSGLMSAVLLVFLAVSGFQMVSQQIEFNQTTSVLELPEWVAGASVPVASVIIVFRVVESVVKELRALRHEGQGL